MNRFLILSALLTISVLILLTPAISYSENNATNSSKSFLTFPNTESSDGHYGIAWRLPKHPDVWAKVRRVAEQYPAGAVDEEVFDSVNEVAQDVENYIVDVRAVTIIHKLQCPRAPGVTSDRKLESEYWIVGDGRPNRHDLEVVWSRRNDFVLINHTYRWDCVTFCAVSVSQGRAPSELDLNKPVGDAVRTFVAKSFPRGSGYTKKDVNVSFSDVEEVGDNKFSAHAEAVIGKQWSSNGATVDFKLIPSNAGRSLKLLDIHVQK